MDQARNILNSYIPATQWAMNYLNNNITHPAQQAAGNFVKGINELPQDMPTNAGFAETTGNAVVNATPAGGAIGDVSKGAHLFQNSHALPLALGLVGNAAPKFGAALRNAGKALGGEKYNVAPKIVESLNPVIERLLNTDPNNAHYAINQQPKDAAALIPIAEHYMPGVTQYFKNDPVQIAQALWHRIREERPAIPQ